jgi:hypothetical protein
MMLLAAAGCGNEIGDSCGISSDCSPNGDRICDIQSPGGYCTIQGCDHDSCPEESICVRFFTVAQTNLPCDPSVDDPQAAGCTVDEFCTLAGYCVPATAEQRYCMRTCGDTGDCRDGYECRDMALMVEHGGEPVLDPDRDPPAELPAFCAAAPPTI